MARRAKRGRASAWKLYLLRLAPTLSFSARPHRSRILALQWVSDYTTTQAERIMIESLVGGTVALGGYAWFKHHQRKLKLEDVERQKRLDEALHKAANEFIEELIMASGLAILEYPEVAAKWRRAASDRLKLIYAGEICNVLRPGFSREFVLKVGELLARADITEQTRMWAANLLYDLTGEVMCKPSKRTALQRSEWVSKAKFVAQWA